MAIELGTSFVADDLGTCPFCGGSIAASKDASGGYDGVLHSTPYCERFNREEPDEFLRSVRVARTTRGTT